MRPASTFSTIQLSNSGADCDGGGATAGSGELEKNQLDKQELSV